MASLIVVIVIALICAFWVRANHNNRQRWLQRLALPGTWVWEGQGRILELTGELDHGRYHIQDEDGDEQGEWRLKGHNLVLEPRTGSSCTLELRLFTEGKIGLHGVGREGRIYVKKQGNVVSLRRPA